MIGILISAALMAIFYLFGNDTIPQALISASNFLYVWYWIWSIFQGFFIVLMSLGITSISAIASGAAGDEVTKSKKGLAIGLITGAIGGAGLSFLLFLKWISIKIMMLIGTYLISTSGSENTIDWQTMDMDRLIFGAVLLAISVILVRMLNKSSSSSGSLSSKSNP